MKSRRFQIDRVTAATAVTTALLAFLTLLVYFSPSFHLVFQNAELSTAIESVSIVIALGAFYLCFARFRITNELRLLLLALAFLILGLYNLVFDILVPVMGDSLEVTAELLAYFWLTARLISGLLLLASLRAGARRVSLAQGRTGVAVVVTVVSLLSLVFLRYGSADLPALISPSGWQLIPNGNPSDIMAEMTTAGGIYQVLIGLCFFAAGIGYARLYQRERRPFWGWLAVSFIAAFFTQIEFMMYPSIYTGYVAPGDFMRLFSRLVLFLGTYAEINYSYRDLQTKNQELAALQDISTLGMSTNDVGEILSGINLTVQKVFEAEKVVMFFPDRKGVDLVAGRLAVGIEDEQASGLRIHLRDDGLAVRTYRDGIAAVANDPNDNDIPAALRQHLSIRNTLVAPLKTGSDTIGIIQVINKKEGGFGEEEARFLTIIAARAAMVIENARLHEQLEATAVLEERTRLAREIHDGLAQNLGYLNLKLPQVQGYVENDTGKALEELGSMRQIVHESLTEARQAIVDLQTQIGDRNFLEAVSEYAREFSDMTDIDVEIVSDKEQAYLKPVVKAELVRIIQEALNNVRRHAEASKVKIVFNGENGNLRIGIIDNGKGFSVEEVLHSRKTRRRFGMDSMKERAVGLGGSVQVTSRPGAGTTVTVEIPQGGKEA